MLRSAISSGSELGREAAQYMDQGRLVPDHLARRIAEDAVCAAGRDNFVLDGYPRTLQQARWLTQYLGARPLEAVLFLQVSVEEVLRRLSRRRMHKQSGEIYHLDTRPPIGIDPSLIFQRPDDRPKAIRERLRVYSVQTEPIAAFYRGRGSLVEVDAAGDAETVYARIAGVLAD